MPNSSTAAARRKPAGAAPRSQSKTNRPAARKAPARRAPAPVQRGANPIWIGLLALVVTAGGMAAGVYTRHAHKQAAAHSRTRKSGHGIERSTSRGRR